MARREQTDERYWGFVQDPAAHSFHSVGLAGQADIGHKRAKGAAERKVRYSLRLGAIDKGLETAFAGTHHAVAKLAEILDMQDVDWQ